MHLVSTTAGQGKQRAAFTIVELLTVCICLALLLGLLQPSIQAALGGSRMSVCMDRLRGIGQANLTYSAEDGSGAALPVHRLQFQQPSNWPTFIGAYEWGGKSGIGQKDFVQGYAGGVLGSKYGTAAGFGPGSRPLNKVLYPGGFRTNYDFVQRRITNRVLAEYDTQLDLQAFRCPADDGPPEGQDGVGPHCPDWIKNPKRSSFDHFGTSYAANIFNIGVGGTGLMLSNSPYLRPLSRVPNPARTLNYEENIGRWAWACRNEIPDCMDVVGSGVSPGPSKTLRGWHGKAWSFNRAFVDAHVEHQTIYIAGTEDEYGYANHYRNERIDNIRFCSTCRVGDYNCPDYESIFESVRCIIIRGDGWQKDTLPAAPICTGLYYYDYGRPSYDGCVSPG